VFYFSIISPCATGLT